MSSNYVFQLIETFGDHPPIVLKDLCEIVLGRRLNSSTTSSLVSKTQVSLTTDVANESILVKNIGYNAIKVGKNPIFPGEYTIASHFDDIQLPGSLVYKVQKVRSTESCGNSNEFNKRMTEKYIHLTFSKFNTGPWVEFDSGKLLAFSQKGFGNISPKVAAFDLDSTLIKTKSGKVFSVNEDDWMFLSNEIPRKLNKLLSENYSLVIFTNQGGIGQGSTSKLSFKNKIMKIINSLMNIPVQFFIAAHNDFYRKPLPGMWLSFVSLNQLSVDYQNSFYVGDAAGRPKGWRPGKKKDFSSADKFFASNVNLNFYTPEEYFLNEKTNIFPMPIYESSLCFLNAHSNYNIPSSSQEVILMVGSPASGKSHFVKKHLVPNGYNCVSRDIIGTWQNCIKIMERDLLSGKNIVIDNTNPSVEVRRRYLTITKRYGIQVRCFVVESSCQICKHNNKFRQITDQNHVYVSDIIINEFWKNYEKPTLAEGIAEICSVPFVPEFENKHDEMLYKMYLLSNI